MSLPTPDPTYASNTDRDTAAASGPGPLTFPELFALPVTVDLATAARTLGISKNTAYRLISRDAFPCTIMRPTYRYRVPTASLMTTLDIELHPIHPDDVTTGIEFVTRTTRPQATRPLSDATIEASERDPCLQLSSLLATGFHQSPTRDTTARRE